MENSTRFDLNVAIQAWRDQLKNSPVLKTENIDELEGHLRDSISRLCASGLSEKEAFLIARQRLGGFEELEREYGKVHREQARSSRALWMWLGAFVLGVAGALTGAISMMASSFLESWGLLPLGWSAAARWGICAAGAIALWMGIQRVLPQLHSAPLGRRPALAAAGLAFAALFLMLPVLAAPLRLFYVPGSSPAGFPGSPLPGFLFLAFAGTAGALLLNRRALAGLAGMTLLLAAPMWTTQWMASSPHPRGPFPVGISSYPFYQVLLLLVLAAVMLGALRRNILGAFALAGLAAIFLFVMAPSLLTGGLPPGSYPFRPSPEVYPVSVISLFLFLTVPAVIWSLLRQDGRAEAKSA